MAYQRKPQTQTGPIQSIEQARRLNAELRLELARLAQENAQLAPTVQTMRAQVTAARKKLTRQVRELETARIQAEHLARVQAIMHPEPVHGGPAGLLAATQELQEHEFKLDKLGRKRRILGPSHGTRDKYDTGCRCDPCMDWRRKKSDRERITQQTRRNRQKLNTAGGDSNSLVQSR